MRPLARAGVMCGAMGVALTGLTGPVSASPGTGSVTTVPSAEAWYRSSPTCATPLGCAPATTSYPAGTLHVGVTLGAEDSRSYLQLDLTRLPAGTKPVGGQLRLPLAPGSDGTSSPETAKLRACLALRTVTAAEGTATAKPPETDCQAASVNAVFVPATGAVPAAFTIDLAALATAWQSAAAPGALALVPGHDVAQTDNWHLAFNEQSRSGAGLVKPTAAIAYTGATVDTSAVPPPVVTAPVQAAPLNSAPLSGGTLAAVLPPALSSPVTALQAPSVARPQANLAPQQRVAPAAFTTAGFGYPGVFLLPLVFAVALTWVGRALTRDLGPS
jgi:hypothetical protein